MKYSIYKYELPDTDFETVLKLPIGAEILSAAAQHNRICIWAKVPNDEYTTESVDFLIAPTGYDDTLSSDRFIGTCFLHGGVIVAHVFVRGHR